MCRRRPAFRSRSRPWLVPGASTAPRLGHRAFENAGGAGSCGGEPREVALRLLVLGLPHARPAERTGRQRSEVLAGGTAAEVDELTPVQVPGEVASAVPRGKVLPQQSEEPNHDLRATVVSPQWIEPVPKPSCPTSGKRVRGCVHDVVHLPCLRPHSERDRGVVAENPHPLAVAPKRKCGGSMYAGSDAPHDVSGLVAHQVILRGRPACPADINDIA